MALKTDDKFKETEIGIIPKDWTVSSLSECIEIIGGGTPRTTIKEYWNGEIPWISVVDFAGDQRWIYDTEKHITKKGLENSSTKLLHKGQLIISARGTVGELGQVTKDMAFNQSCYGINGKTGLDNDFLYYLLRQKVKDFQQKGHGAVFNTITRETFNQILIPIPSMSEQRAIAKILSDLDLKILLNKKVNKNLEAFSQALFKSWFVDFEFPNEEDKPYKSTGGEMTYNENLDMDLPKGWKVAALVEVAEFTRGFSYSGAEKSNLAGEFVFVTLNSIRKGGGFKREFSYLTSERLRERHFIQEGDLIIANTHFGVGGSNEARILGIPALIEYPKNYAKEKGCFSHHITRVTPQKKEMKYYLYEYLLYNQAKAVEYKTGSFIWALDVKAFAENEKIPIPNSTILNSFSQSMDIVFRKKSLNSKQSESFAVLRDNLLPKLISGKIRIPLIKEDTEVK